MFPDSKLVKRFMNIDIEYSKLRVNKYVPLTKLDNIAGNFETNYELIIPACDSPPFAPSPNPPNEEFGSACSEDC